jgi:hypothetical protein
MQEERLKSIGEVIQSFSKQKRFKKPIQEARVINYWPELMGVTVNRYTEKIYVNYNTLFVKVGPDALRNELLYSTDVIIEKINEYIGEEIIKKIVLL